MPPLQRRRSMGDRSRRTADGGGRLHSAAAGIVGLAPPAVDPPCVAPTPPLNGGEFLLQLLRRPPQSSAAAPSPAPSASPLPIDGQRGRQHLPHGQYEDPAVAAVGPSHPFSPPNFSNFGSPQQQFPPWLFPQVQSQPPRPSPPLGFSPPAGFSVSPPAGFSVSPPVGYSTSPPVGYSASPPGINYHEPRSLSGGNRPSFFQREAGQPPVFAPRNLHNGDHRGNLRDTFSQQQQQRQQPNSNYKQNHHRDVFSAGGTASGNVMFGSQPSNLQPNGGRGLITGNPSAFAGRSQFGAESRNSKAGPASGHDRWLGNGGSEENKPLPSSRRASHPEGWSGQRGNQHPVRETRTHAPMTGQAPPGFHDPPVQRHSRMDSRREASNSQQKPNGSGHRTLMDNGSDRDFGLKRHEYPQRKQNHQSFAQRMGTQANERQVQLDADQYLSHSVAELDVKELVEDTLSEDEDEDAFLEEHDNEIEHNSEPKAISSSTLHEVKSLAVQLEGSLLLKEEVVECEVKKSRKKDFRTDFSRGFNVSTQRYRIRRGAMQCRRDIRKLSPHFFSIYELLAPTEEEKSKQKQLLLLLQKIVTKEWPSAQLHLYGSCANSFGVLKSDIDVCLEIDDIETNKSDLLLNLAEMLQSDNLQNVQALTRARVPIVKLMDPVTGLSCDICINNLLAVVNTKLLRDYGKIDERLRQLAFIVKHWAKSRGVNETYQGTLSSYAYVIMCIHFLQMRRPPILPCLQMLEPTYITTVDGVECSFFDQVEKLQNFGSANKESVAELLWAFFNYWAYRHDYANDVISVRTGSILSKREKDWTRRIGNDRHLICIEDPFEVSHDLGRVVDKHTIKVLREEFERAADILQFDANPCAVLFEPYVREPPPPSPPAAENQAELGVV